MPTIKGFSTRNPEKLRELALQFEEQMGTKLESISYDPRHKEADEIKDLEILEEKEDGYVIRASDGRLSFKSKKSKMFDKSKVPITVMVHENEKPKKKVTKKWQQYEL